MLKNNLHDLMRPLVLDSPPLGRKKSEKLSIAVQTENNGIGNDCPVILLTETTPTVEKNCEEFDSGEEERHDIVAELPVPIIRMRRNSQ